MKMLRSNRLGILAVLGGVCLVGAAVAVSQQGPAISGPGQAQAEALSITFRDVANRVLPAVVSVETRTKPVELTQSDSRRSPFEDEFFQRFFGNTPGLPDMDTLRRRVIPPQRGSASGFIIDADGVILTNSHVVQNAETVTVRLYDGREIEASEWFTDPRSDVAIVRVETSDRLPTISMGNSDDVEIGDWVLALGNPFDIGTTVTAGIISAKQRNTGINIREGYLQTDAAINPGNSGGPLVNLHGEVIGMNTAISTRSGGYDGVGFAIPINNARWVAEQLIADGAVRRAYMGVLLVPIASDLREGLNIPRGQGALVGEVLPDSPAEQAGLKEGDVILKCAGRTVKDQSALQGIVEALEIGKTYPLEVLRYDGKGGTARKTLSVTVKEFDVDEEALAVRPSRRGSTKGPGSESFKELGLEIGPITKERREQLQLDDNVHGVLIMSVEPDSPAAKAELQPGDVIEKFGGQEISSPDDFAQALKSAEGARGVPVLVRRGGAPRFVFLKLND